MGPLKVSLRALADGGAPLPAVLAARSARLVKFAARLLFHPCRNVLATDLDWPAWADILASEAERVGRTITRVAVRDVALSGRLSADEIVHLLCDRFVRSGCDGLYLTAISSLGVRTPVERVVTRLEAACGVRAIVVDGAQDYCQVRPSAAVGHCDLYLAGTHKWLGAHHPLGVGFYGRGRSRGRVETILAAMIAAGDLDDPLLRFTAGLEAGDPGRVEETVNLAALFAAQGAAADAHRSDGSLGARLANAERAVAVVAGAGWRAVRPAPDLCTGILLLRPERREVRDRDPGGVRAALREEGIAATVHTGGVVRLSMPAAGWHPGELDHLARGLSRVA